jgi:predicted transcriptional regulator
MPRSDSTQHTLGARARAVLEIIYRLGEVSGPDLMRELPSLPSYSALRSILRQLESKGLVRHRMDGPRYVFRPTVPKSRASRNALRRVVDTYFGGMPEHALKALLDVTRDRHRTIDYDSLQRLIDEARESET